MFWTTVVIGLVYWSLVFVGTNAVKLWLESRVFGDDENLAGR